MTPAEVRQFHPLGGVSDSEIEAHLRSSLRKLEGRSFLGDEDKIEAVACQTIIYIAPLLWARGMQNLAGYETVYASAGDVETFQNIWRSRLEEVILRSKKSEEKRRIQWAGA